jgi:hypothetical protein
MEPLKVKGGKGVVGLEPPGLIHLVWDVDVRIEEVDAKAAMAAVNKVANGAEYPMLVDMANTRSVSRQARAVFSIPCAASRIALLGTSPVDRVLANFFLGIHIPPCPTRFFTSRPDALGWVMSDKP